jgi:hypothetical protein
MTPGCCGKFFIPVGIECSICLDTKNSSEFWTLPCGHVNCKACLQVLGFSEKIDHVTEEQARHARQAA